MIAIHCSALPRALGKSGCPASLQAPQIDIAGTSDDADLGSAVHQAMALHVQGMDVDLQFTAAAWGVEESALAPLYHVGRRLWSRHSEALQVVGVETHIAAQIFPDVEILGTADLFARTVGGDQPDVLVNADWKSTEGRDPLDQQIGYGVCYFGGKPEPFKIISYFLRDGADLVRDISADDVAAWKGRLRYAVDHPEKFCPSPSNCQWCRRALECPARLQLARASWEIVTNPGEEWNALTPAEKGDLYLKVQFAGKFLETIKDMYREEIKAHGNLPLADGREIALIPNNREAISVEDAWPVLAREFGVSEADLLHLIAPALTVGKGKVSDILGATAPKGQKGKRITAAMDALREANALTEIVGEMKLCVRRAVKS
jgi:hypothetical protein